MLMLQIPCVAQGMCRIDPSALSILDRQGHHVDKRSHIADATSTGNSWAVPACRVLLTSQKPCLLLHAAWLTCMLCHTPGPPPWLQPGRVRSGHYSYLGTREYIRHAHRQWLWRGLSFVFGVAMMENTQEYRSHNVNRARILGSDNSSAIRLYIRLASIPFPTEEKPSLRTTLEDQQEKSKMISLIRPW